MPFYIKILVVLPLNLYMYLFLFKHFAKLFQAFNITMPIPPPVWFTIYQCPVSYSLPTLPLNKHKFISYCLLQQNVKWNYWKIVNFSSLLYLIMMLQNSLSGDLLNWVVLVVLFVLLFSLIQLGGFLCNFPIKFAVLRLSRSVLKFVSATWSHLMWCGGKMISWFGGLIYMELSSLYTRRYLM